MADGAPFAQRRVLENKWTRLFAMTGRAGLIKSCHRQATCRFENIASVRVMTLGTVHLLLGHRMMLRQQKLSLDRPMALETGRGVFARIYDEFAFASASRDVQA